MRLADLLSRFNLRQRGVNSTTAAGAANLSIEQLEARLALAATPVGGAELVNDLVVRVQSAEHASESVALVGDRQVVVFEGKGPVDPAGVFAEVTDDSGSVVRSSFRVNTTIRSEQHSPSVTVAGDGSFVVAWAGRGVGDKSGVFFQRFDRDGVAVGSETLANGTTGGVQAEPTVALDADGSIAIAWSGTGSGDVSGVFLRRFDADGGTLGGETLVNMFTSDHQTSPSLAYESGGDLIVAWQSRHQDGSDWGVYAQRFDSLGERVGEETQLNATTDQSQSSPDVAADPDGGVVVAWQSHGQDGDGWGIVAREFDDSVSPVGDEVVLNGETAGHQERVSVAVAADGQWLATWSSGQPDGAGWEAVARSFEPDGVAGDEQVVTAAASGINSGHQRFSGIAVTGDAATVVWTGNGETDHHGVYAQEFAVDANNGVHQSPDLAPIDDQMAAVGEVFEIVVTAIDPNPLDTLTFLLDPDNSPTDAVLEQLGNNTARIRWMPPASALGQDVPFRVLVVDDGDPPLADSEDFLVSVGEPSSESSLSEAATDEAFSAFE